MIDMRANRLTTARRGVVSEGIGAFFERLRAARERAHMRRVVSAMLEHSDAILDDVGLSRTVLLEALNDPSAYPSFEHIRRESADRLKQIAAETGAKLDGGKLRR
ncbi:MAG: hypothetical protein AAGM38_11180 [Pseudomonadota bacterium]